MAIHDVRLNNAELILAKHFQGKKSALAKEIGKIPSYVSRWWAKSSTQRRNISSDSARLIENAAGLPEGWMDLPHDESDLETDPLKKSKQKIATGDTKTIKLQDRCTIDNNMTLNLLNTNIKGELMLLSTDSNAYAFQFIGHHSNPILSEGWGVVIEPSTPLAEGEYAVIKLTDGQLLLRIITYSDENVIIAMNPLDKQQSTLLRNQIEKAEYCYIGIPPSKIARDNNSK